MTKLLDLTVLSRPVKPLYYDRPSPDPISSRKSLVDNVYLCKLINNLNKIIPKQTVIDEGHWYNFILSLCELCDNEYNKYKSDDLATFKLWSSEINKKKNGNFWTLQQSSTRKMVTMPTEAKDKFLAAVRSGDKLSAWFPFKPQLAAATKSNLYLDDLLKSLKHYSVAYYNHILDVIPHLFGLSNDQCTNLIFSHYYLLGIGHSLCLRSYSRLVYTEDLWKAVSDFTKQMGIALNPFLSVYTEGDCLYGRASVPFDIQKEMDQLSGKGIPVGHNIQLPKGYVYQQAMLLFEEAMPQVASTNVTVRHALCFPSIEDFWKNRLMNSVNGSHHMPDFEDDNKIPKGVESTRMVYMENENQNPLFVKIAQIVASWSYKLENPKVRVVKSQDTISYIHEDYIHKVIDKHWSHKSVLMEPALQTKGEEADRVANMLGDTYVMLDYASMDKQHSLQSQLELTQAKVDFLGLPQHMKQWFMDAERNQFIRYEGKKIKMKYSLLTGRRSTTFINSCLNYIYLKFSLGAASSFITTQYHAGDDIILKAESELGAEIILEKALNSPVVFNKRKQSWGPGGEFLRHSVYKNKSYGYLNRSIASFVCGSWVSDLRLNGGNVYNLYYRYGWTLDLRGHVDGAAANMISFSLHKRTGLALNSCYKICKHQSNVVGGPVNVDYGSVTTYYPVDEVKLNAMPVLANSYATDEYITTQAKKLLVHLDTQQLSRVRGALKLSSYRKGLSSEFKSTVVTESTRPVQSYAVSLSYSYCHNVEKGVLGQHPTLPSIRGLVDNHTLKDVVYLFTGQGFVGKTDFLTWIWGEEPNTISTPLNNNFDDLIQTAKRRYTNNPSTIMRIFLPREVYY